MVYEPQGNAIFNDDDSMMRAVLQGVGLMQHIDLCVRPHLEHSTLVRVLRKWRTVALGCPSTEFDASGVTATLWHRRSGAKYALQMSERSLPRFSHV